jgi:hypothetical protein
MDSEISELCPEQELAEVIQLLQEDDEVGLIRIDQLLLRYPEDARLHFLQGSVFAGLQRYAEGRLAMSNAIRITPEYDLARFQLGFLELTSGFAAAAAITWQPFVDLPANSAFRALASGLNCLARDDFAECDRLLRIGMAANTEYPLINGDMQLILDEIAGQILVAPQSGETDGQPASATHQLLQQFALKDSATKTKH